MTKKARRRRMVEAAVETVIRVLVSIGVILAPMALADVLLRAMGL